MAGEWIKFEANTPEKPEVFAITNLMEWDDPDMTVGKLLKVWRWFDQQTINGNASNVTLSLLDRVSGVSGFAQAMCDVGWLRIDSDGVSLPNFDRHNGKTAKDRALTAKRVAKHKSNAKANDAGNDSVVTSALPREEKRREENKTIMSDKSDAVSILEYLNQKTEKNYRPVDSNIRLIASRLKEGATPEDCRSVIDSKVLKWGGDPKMNEYLRPATLFAAKNFAQYVGDLSRSSVPVWER